jgi:hypothetical protein
MMVRVGVRVRFSVSTLTLLGLGLVYLSTLTLILYPPLIPQEMLKKQQYQSLSKLEFMRLG